MATVTTSNPPRTRERVRPQPSEAQLEGSLMEGLVAQKRETISVVSMPTDQFIAVADHPAQRDTEMHARLARKAHLAKAHEAHRNVSIAEFLGKSYKLDGHTRSFLWREGALDKPETVIATVFRVETVEELLSLYETFDNNKAAKNSKDSVSSAIRFLGLDPQSSFLRKYKYHNALRVLHYITTNSHNDRNFDTIETLSKFADEFMMLDTVITKSDVYRSGVVVASLLLLKRFGDRILPFLEGISHFSGSKSDRICDAIYAANTVIQHHQDLGQGGSELLAAKIVSCGEAYIAHRDYTVLTNGTVYVKPKNDLHQFYMRSVQARSPVVLA